MTDWNGEITEGREHGAASTGPDEPEVPPRFVPPVFDPGPAPAPSRSRSVFAPPPLTPRPVEPPIANRPPLGVQGSGVATPPSVAAAPPTRPRGRWVPWTIAAVAVALAAFSVGWIVRGDGGGAETAIANTSAPAPAELAPDSEPSGAPPEPPIVNVPGPVQGEVAEPVAEVAAAVAPAVVLIQTEAGQGSGIIYDGSGLILTNAHVVGEADEVLVRLASGVRVEGVVVGADPSHDTAVVEISTDEQFGVAVLAPSDSLEVGQLAVAIGSPFGLEQTVTSGVVSATSRVLNNQVLGIDSVVDMIQTDAPINPGNSGGALADREGRVIGMNTAIQTDGSNGNVGVGFAIPSDTAKLIADRIVSGEPLESGYLGVNGQDAAIGRPGALIVDVVSGDPADVAGLEVGDLIVGVEGDAVTSMSDLAARVRLETPGAMLRLDVLRDGESVFVDVTLGVLGG